MDTHEARQVAQVFGDVMKGYKIDEPPEHQLSFLLHWLADAAILLQRMLPEYDWVALTAEANGVKNAALEGAILEDACFRRGMGQLYGVPRYRPLKRVPEVLGQIEARRVAVVVRYYAICDVHIPLCAQVLLKMQEQFDQFDWLELFAHHSGQIHVSDIVAAWGHRTW